PPRSEPTSSPPTRTSPESGRSSPPSRLSSVLLPAPDRPSSTTSSPSSIARSTSISASTRRPVLKCLETWWATAASLMFRVARFRRKDRDPVLVEVQPHAVLQRELLDVRLGKLDPARAIHDHEL